MQRRRVTILASSLFLILSMFVPAATGAVLAKEPNLDVRGKWQLVWSGFDGKSSNRLHATADIRKENLRTGAFTGDYVIPEQPLGTGTYQRYDNTFSGKVRGHTARLVGVDANDGVLNVVLVEKGDSLTLSGSLDGILLEGKLVTPAPPQSPEGGDRPSSTTLDCMSVTRAAIGTLWCVAGVDDHSGRKKAAEPGGQVSVGVPGATHAASCDLVGAAGSGSTSCLMSVLVPAAAAGDGNAQEVTVEYAGDKHFGPSEGSWFVPVDSAPAVLSPDSTQRLLDLELELVARELEIVASRNQQLIDIIRNLAR